MVATQEASALLPNQLESARRIFAGCLLFSDLIEGESRSLGMRLRFKNFSPGETIFRMGDPGEAMMAVLSGAIKVSVSSEDGNEIILAVLHPNDIIGEVAILDGRERTADHVCGHGSWMCCVGGYERPMNILLMSRCCRCRSAWPKH